MDHTICVVESQVDWLTITAPREGPFHELMQLGFRLVSEQVEIGNQPHAWAWKGYDGAHCGKVTYGERQDGAILQVSGAEADRVFMSALHVGGKATRIDLQVTANCGSTPPNYAEEAYHAIQTAPLVRGTRPKGTLYQNTDGGATCYIGSPSSDHRGRIYDKHMESGLDYYDNCWRWEVETRSDLANTLMSNLGDWPGMSAAISGYVWSWFEGRSVRVPWTASPSFTCATQVADPTDIGRKIQWLDKQVRPTVEFLTAAGYEQDARLALGLT